jgi:hypothetical protein
MKKLLSVFVLLNFFAVVKAQTKDVQLWTGPILKYNITKKIRLDFEQQFRFNENISSYDFTFSEFAVRYKVFKYLDVKAVYRHSFIPEVTSGSVISEYDKSRICFDASTGIEIFNTGLEIGYRIRYQDSWEHTTMASTHYIRNRFDLSYNLSKLVDPYTSWDNFYRLDGKNEVRQNRYVFGLTWKITKDLDIDSYYLFQKDKNVKIKNLETIHVIGLAVIYSIN